MKNDMMLIMENWRKGQEKLLLEGKILDWIKQSIKKGFEKLTKEPEELDAMVEDAKASFEEIMRDKIEALQEDPEIQEIAKIIADAIESNAKNGDIEMDTSDLEESKEESEELYAPFEPGRGQEKKGWRDEPDKPSDWMPDKLTRTDLMDMGLSDEQVNILEEKYGVGTAESVLEASERATGKLAPPEVKDFLVRFLKRSSKMIVFGFVDNFIMITAGDYIDPGLKHLLGTTTLFAAGLGNMISDVAGEEAGGTIDSVLKKMGLDTEDVSDEQIEVAPGWMQLMDKRAGTFGVAIGCLLGMIPLVWMQTPVSEDKEKDDRETLI